MQAINPFLRRWLLLSYFADLWLETFLFKLSYYIQANIPRTLDPTLLSTKEGSKAASKLKIPSLHTKREE